MRVYMSSAYPWILVRCSTVHVHHKSKPQQWEAFYSQQDKAGYAAMLSQQSPLALQSSINPKVFLKDDLPAARPECS